MTAEEIRKLNLAERIQLLDDDRESIADEPEAWELTQEQKDELNRRLAAHKDNPKAGSSWNEVKASLRATR